MTRGFYFVAGVIAGALSLRLSDAIAYQDPAKLSPQYYSVRFENDRVRVLEYHLKPGEREAMHSHPPRVVYVLGGATLRSTLPDGTSSELRSRAGEVIWRDAVSHSVVNVGQTEAHALGIDLKACQP